MPLKNSTGSIFTNQNVARIMSEGIAGKINTCTNPERSFSRNVWERPATAVELADDPGWPLKEVRGWSAIIARML